MTAAEIIARALCEWTGSGQGVDDMLAEISASQSDAILSSLAAEAKRILAPDELDAKTIEACAKVAQKHLDPSSFALAGPASVITQTVARIRALAKQEAKE